MDLPTGTKVSHLVVDAAAFLQNTQLQDLADNVYTVVEVVKEIKDRNTLDRLQVLPYEINYQQPSAEDIQAVRSFARKTGDYHVLSAPDVKVIAATLALHKQHIGTESIHSEPIHKRETNSLDGVTANEKLPGFYTPKENEESDSVNVEEIDGDEETAHEENDDSDDGFSDDEDSWITPENISKSSDIEVVKMPVVACITKDFAVQNVLKQMGLNIISLDGVVIKELRTYLLRCYACFHVTAPDTKSVPFCPRCGNRTLKRVSVVVDENGKQHINVNFKRPLTGKGKKFSLPLPKGGQMADNPVLSADMKKRPLHKKQNQYKIDPFSDEFIVSNSPFAVHNLRSNLGLGGQYFNRRNPNEVVKKSRRKK